MKILHADDHPLFREGIRFFLKVLDPQVTALEAGSLQATLDKLARAGLGEWFRGAPGGFGSDSEDRAALPAIARRRAGHTAREETIVIGDTPRDIACARADGVRCVAVTTGWFGTEELTGADAVAADADELREVLARLGV